jgi:membrane associated rhomboid family serine protease
MFPISDDNPTLRTPVMTYLTLGGIAFVWFFFQGAGFNTVALAASVCTWGMVPGELTGKAPLGFQVPLGEGLACIVDNETINHLTPLTSMFLHGGWGHIIGNCLFLWVFGNNVEDSMGRVRFVIFYLLCGLVAAGAHVLVDPSSPVPTVGASGAISGVLGAYLVLYPRVRVKLLVPIFILLYFVSLPAWVVLIYWFVLQVITGLPQLMPLRPEISGGVAVWAHIGGFVAGVVLIKLFENRRYTAERTTWRHRLHPDHP